MTEHFRWYPSRDDATVPWSAQYSYPSQSNKITKTTPRIPPKNGALFQPAPLGNQYIRLELPAQGYLNPQNTTLEFDVDLLVPTTAVTPAAFGTGTVCNFQNNIQSIFRRVRIMYGSTPLEDIQDYHSIQRMLTELSGTTQVQGIDNNSLTNGIGGVVMGASADGVTNPRHVRRTIIQGFDGTSTTGGLWAPNARLDYSGSGYQNSRRRYQIQLNTGLFIQPKWIPLKWMAGQFAIEIELARPEECIYVASPSSGIPAVTYAVTNVNLIPEILECDAAYDEAFLRGLRDSGVPIKFSTWHTFTFNVGNSGTASLNIQERSRSVKAVFAVQKAPATLAIDSGATLYASGAAGDYMQSYQYRIGGRFFPAAPVVCGEAGRAISAEAFTELEKALHTLGDDRLSINTSALNFAAIAPQNTDDYAVNFDKYDQTTGAMVYSTKGTVGNIAAPSFVAAINLESSNGMEISGLNAEEQSDIALNVQWSSGTVQSSGNTMTVFTYFDCMLILKENNNIQLIM